MDAGSESIVFSVVDRKSSSDPCVSSLFFRHLLVLRYRQAVGPPFQSFLSCRHPAPARRPRSFPDPAMPLFKHSQLPEKRGVPEPFPKGGVGRAAKGVFSSLFRFSPPQFTPAASFLPAPGRRTGGICINRCASISDPLQLVVAGRRNRFPRPQGRRIGIPGLDEQTCFSAPLFHVRPEVSLGQCEKCDRVARPGSCFPSHFHFFKSHVFTNGLYAFIENVIHTGAPHRAFAG